nr:helix-turn-helix domain-containing protein [Enterococcus gallinarum]
MRGNKTLQHNQENFSCFALIKACPLFVKCMAGVNQLERDLIRMRQREGIELAKKEGKFKGRLKKYHKNHAGMNYAVKLYKEGGMTVNQICEITNVSRASLYRRLSEGNK